MTLKSLSVALLYLILGDACELRSLSSGVDCRDLLAPRFCNAEIGLLV